MKKVLPPIDFNYRTAIMLLALAINIAITGECLAKVYITSAIVDDVSVKDFGPRKNSDTGKGKRLGPGLLDNFEENVLHEGEKVGDQIRKNLFVIVSASKTNCFPGEPLLITYKLYSRIHSTSSLTKQPQLNGFAVYDMIDHVSFNETMEVRDGRRYKVHILKKAQVVPLQSGMLELDALELAATVHFIKTKTKSKKPGRKLDNMLDQFLLEERAPQVTAKTKIISSTLNISVTPFPEANRPASFNGAVGNFAITASIPARNITTNNPAVLVIDLKGEGYTPLIGQPVIGWPMGIDSFDVSSTEGLNYDVMPLQVRKTFRYTFVPTRKGRYKTTSVSFCFFDPSTKSYKTIEASPIEFQVFDEKAPISKHSITISKDEHKATEGNRIRKNLTAVLLVLFFLLARYMAYGIYILLKNRKSKVKAEMANADQSSGITEVSRDEVADPLRTAAELLKIGEHQAFFREVNNVIWDALALKLGLPLSELNKQNIAVKLKLRGWNNDTIETMLTVLTECEINVYISGYSSEADAQAEHYLQVAGKMLVELKKK